MTSVYIVTQNGDDFPCKIGMSDNPEARLASLQAGSPNKLALRETYECDTRQDAARLERLFHDTHVEYRMNGEWFGLHFDEANYWLFQNTIALEVWGPAA